MLASAMSNGTLQGAGDFFRVREDSPHCIVSHICQVLDACSKHAESKKFEEFNAAVAKLVDLLGAVCHSAHSDSADVGWKDTASHVLIDTHKFITSQSCNEEVIEIISSELPKVVARFAGVSEKCREHGERIILYLSETSNARDTLSFLCEALDSLIEVFKSPSYFIPLLSGISKVLSRIHRRVFEQVKEALPGILKVLKFVSLELDDRDGAAARDLIRKTVDITFSIQALCQLARGKTDELRALLGLFVLQIMALITSRNLAPRLSSCSYFIAQCSQHIPFCGLSYVGLLTGSDIDRLATILGEEDDDFLVCLDLARLGAAVAVIWGYISSEVANAAGEDLETLKADLCSSQIKRLQAIGILKFVLSSAVLSWELKSNCIELLLSFFDKKSSQGALEDCTLYFPLLFCALKGLQAVIIYASDGVLRKKAYIALKEVLRDIPIEQRLCMLKALVVDGSLSSMIALLMDFAKEAIHDDIKKLRCNISPTSNWTCNILDLVEVVLKPSHGGPPHLPEQSEAVVAALNLYRYLLILESTGKISRFGVLLEDRLHKAYTEWLLPLRAVVSAIEGEIKNADCEIASLTLCSLNPLQLVLCRCIELVEENM